MQKNWLDNNNQDGIRPSSVTVVLEKKNGEDGEWADCTDPKVSQVLNDENEWKYTFESTDDAPLYKYKEGGKQIEYTNIGIISHIQEIDYYNIILLPITMTTPDWSSFSMEAIITTVRIPLTNGNS